MLVDNRQIALHQFLKLRKRFQINTKLFSSYQAVLHYYFLKIPLISAKHPPTMNIMLYNFYHTERLFTMIEKIVKHQSYPVQLRLSLVKFFLMSVYILVLHSYPDVFKILLSFRLNAVALISDMKQACLQTEEVE